MDELIKDLLDMDLVNDNQIVFTQESRELINTIANQCRDTDLYKYASIRGICCSKDMTAEELFIDLLYKIVNAPSEIHMHICARLLIPQIDEKLNS